MLVDPLLYFTRDLVSNCIVVRLVSSTGINVELLVLARDASEKIPASFD
jgi:hypothetical protein